MSVRIGLPPRVREILGVLSRAGYEAFAVGGCVRDSLLGRAPQDWDITTSAAPAQVKALFGRTVDTGIAHGTVTVLLGGEGFEVTTYRIDGSYEDGRHPSRVTFTASLEEDLRRRDFTVNAMAYNEERGLVDPFGGVEDMGRRCIRCVGDPRERFGEDALRMMRAVRFSAQLGYEIQEQTRLAVQALSGNLRQISAERIQAELVKLLTSPHPDYLRICWETGITAVVLPEFDRCMDTPQNHPHHCYNVGEHILKALTCVRGEKVLRLAVLLHDIGKPRTLTVDGEGITHFHGHARVGGLMAREILERLRFDRNTQDKVCRLVEFHDYGNGVSPDETAVRRAVCRVGEDIFPQLLEVRRADTLAQSRYLRREKLGQLEEWQRIYGEIMARGECVSLKTLAVSGRDLIQGGMKPGRAMGETLQELLAHVLEHPEDNRREILLERVFGPGRP